MVSTKFIQATSQLLAMEETAPLLNAVVNHNMGIPSAPFTRAVHDAQGRRLPQAISHRGYKAAFPENTMGAFVGAVNIGTHAIETDIHLSKDGVVVLSHDPTLKRCFGVDKKIIDCDWSYLETLTTLRQPAQSLPRLKDLLEYIATPGLEHIWVLLDIKMDNNADDVMRLIASTIAEVKPSRPWKERIVLGCWTAAFIPLCTKYLPEFPISHIGFSVAYARQLLKIPNISFNMLQKSLVGRRGNRFLKDCQAAGRPVFLWTVNDEGWMRWSIGKGVDGVITDDPKKYLEVCDSYDWDAPPYRFTIWDYSTLALFQFLIVVFESLFRLRYGSGLLLRVDISKVLKQIREYQSESETPKLA